ncbi:MAG: hypothetical protein WBG90_06765 [Saonia sp.]
MKRAIKTTVICFVIMLTTSARQNTDTEVERTENILEAFDFWIGSWEATWDESEGVVGKGTNEIKKILDGKVIQENFQITEGKGKGFKGTSISIYQTKWNRWKQAWADNQGGYFDFTGDVSGDEKIFRTTPLKKDGKKILSRMVFKDVRKDAFTWYWEKSKDGGKSWKLLWRINYKRALK